MFEVKFYYDKSGKSDVLEYLESLAEKGKTGKREYVLYNKKILAYIVALKRFGIGQPRVVKVRNDIWELRPSTMLDRILFFHWTENMFILLHHYVISPQKIRNHEIEIAEIRRNDYIKRFGDSNEAKINIVTIDDYINDETKVSVEDHMLIDLEVELIGKMIKAMKKKGPTQLKLDKKSNLMQPTIPLRRYYGLGRNML